jgi:hypothetical protein
VRQPPGLFAPLHSSPLVICLLPAGPTLASPPVPLHDQQRSHVLFLGPDLPVPLLALRSYSLPRSGPLLPYNHASYSPSSHPNAASNVTENIQNLINNSGAAGTRTPILDEAGRVPRRGINKRKQTLLSLLDALSELTGDDGRNGETCASS